jgi:hypothetical protein
MPGNVVRRFSRLFLSPGLTAGMPGVWRFVAATRSRGLDRASLDVRNAHMLRGRIVAHGRAAKTLRGPPDDPMRALRWSE